MSIPIKPETIPISDAILKAVEKAIEAELVYEQATNCGRKFGITGEVGEILACKKLGMQLVKDPRSAGFDAVDKDGCHVQIKTRRAENGDLPKDAGRLSKFSSHDCRYVLMVILKKDYTLAEIWKADFVRLQPIIRKHKHSNPTLRQFKSIGERVY